MNLSFSRDYSLEWWCRLILPRPTCLGPQGTSHPVCPSPSRMNSLDLTKDLGVTVVDFRAVTKEKSKWVHVGREAGGRQSLVAWVARAPLLARLPAEWSKHWKKGAFPSPPQKSRALPGGLIHASLCKITPLYTEAHFAHYFPRSF